MGGSRKPVRVDNDISKMTGQARQVRNPGNGIVIKDEELKGQVRRDSMPIRKGKAKVTSIDLSEDEGDEDGDMGFDFVNDLSRLECRSTKVGYNQSCSTERDPGLGPSTTNPMSDHRLEVVTSGGITHMRDLRSIQ